MQKLYVNNTKITNPNFKGINMIHQMYEYMPDKYDRVYNEEQCALQFDTFKKMRVKMIRSFYGASLCWDNVKKDFNFEPEHMQAFYKSCKEFKKAGVEIGITPQWSLKAFLDDPYEGELPNATTFRFGAVVKDDLEATALRYEEFVKRSVLEFEKHGIELQPEVEILKD